VGRGRCPALLLMSTVEQRQSTWERVAWAFVLGTVLIFGPIFGAIAWATQRNPRNLQNQRRNSNTGKH
jgi:uncharacterized membrane protein YgdD (TMEM256/DUF423 family)